MSRARPATISDPKEALRGIRGGRVLDVATGRGGFVHDLVAGLDSYDEIVGIDADPSLGAPFEDAFAGNPNIRFEAIDALRTTFSPGSFDTVTMSASLHHFDDEHTILSAMRRLVRPGGTLVIAEMYADGQTEAQRTHVLLHHWCAAVDRRRGDVHRDTYRRSDLVRLLTDVLPDGLVLADVADTSADPRDPETLETLDGVIYRYIGLAAGRGELVRRGERLRRRLHRVGVHGAATLVATGRT
jgi:ubiquinone/menaquinone biosynthesis C-methylase UbiE